MKVKGHASVHGSPKFRLRAHADPVRFETEGAAKFKLATGSITAKVHEIPIKVRIPFLRRCHGIEEVAMVGGFGICVEPVEVGVEAFGVRFSGMLGGKEGLDCDVDGSVECRHEVDLEGAILGKLAKVSIALEDDPPGDVCKD